MTRRTKVAAGALFAVVMLALTACAQGVEQTADGLTKITYASFPGPSGLPAKFGDVKGFFEEEGLEVTFVESKDPVGLVSSGDVQIADSDTTSAVIAAGKSAPIKIVSSMYRTKGPFYLIGGENATSIEDLKGKRIGIGRKGSGMEVYTKYILREHNISESDVTLVATGAYQPAYAALESGQVDATIIHEPFVSLAEANGVGTLLAKGWDYLPDFHTGVEITGTQFATENPDVLKSFLKAYFRSAIYAKENRSEFRDYAIEQIKVPAEVQDSALEREEPIWENNPQVDQDALRKTQEIQRDLGFQDEIYDTGEVVDTSYMPDVAQLSGGEAK
ncbi:myristoyl transferase [Prauserella marina]|uniref:NitT/TauT family transport system substrate-binding protein n=1 Tax=Prauserella marina TaxID=530584 RepID=A0A222VRG9_9PSEU|nr:ABC transporter substrate-binding protein [Prauserella marina]ASR36321.1 myristoyl transferase [Prauserella marina]PWV77104.1 NitT/TauT family transport system substrate-binding protein [Prauserella marina]SDD04526.1 NitT/TauT family transport system substrate-binding protein [Prauserella marina]